MKRILHLIHRDPLAAGDLAACRRVCRPGDGVLLSGAAVSAALAGPNSEALEPGITWYVLSSDLALHGLGARILQKTVDSVDYPGFVDLVCEYDLCQSW